MAAKSRYPRARARPGGAHFAGRPTAMPTMRRCAEYAKRHGGVWFAHKGEIAR